MLAHEPLQAHMDTHMRTHRRVAHTRYLTSLHDSTYSLAMMYPMLDK